MTYRNLLGVLWLVSVSSTFVAEEEILLLFSGDRIGLLTNDGTEPGAEELIRRYYALLAAPAQEKLKHFKCSWLIVWTTTRSRSQQPIQRK